MAAKTRRKLAMTNWYNPVVLVATAIRVAISTVFGQLADRREAIAASNAIEPQPFDDSFDLTADGDDFWFDFLADTGDGWNSTYAMARLLSEPTLDVDGAPAPLPRGKALFIGGDLVYPTASRLAYDERFLAPFEEAYHPTGGTARWPDGEQSLFAIPGNHDWYDGLNSFFGLFCRRRVKPAVGIGFDRPGRKVAGRATHQTRSYFAVKLPGRWWLWGTDSQLEGYIDQPQIDYFRHAARHWMKPGSKLILLVGQPSWAYVDPEEPHAAFSNFSYLERLAGAEEDDAKKPLGHQLKLVLTGDAHHYARFTEDDREYITCGGGGAFLHPTHWLQDRSFRWDYPPPGIENEPDKDYRREFRIASSKGKEALYPSRAQSRRLTWWNVAFAGINYPFTLTLFVAYFLFHWLLHFNAAQTEAGSLAGAVGDGSLGQAIAGYWGLVILSPAAAILILLALGAYYYAADARDGLPRLLMGGAHALAQAAVVTVTTILVIQRLPDVAPGWAILAAAVAAALASATVYGVYLLTSLRFFGKHWNEAFSSFAYRGFKAMLRMKIDRDGRLSIFPIGLTKVPRDRGATPRNPKLSPHLIEGPIVLS